MYGQLTQELKDAERDSPLKVKLKNLAHKISYFGYTGAVLIFLAVLLHKMFLAGGPHCIWQTRRDFSVICSRP